MQKKTNLLQRLKNLWKLSSYPEVTLEVTDSPVLVLRKSEEGMAKIIKRKDPIEETINGN